MVARIDLLDCSREPTDDELGELMASVVAEARVRAAVANAALACTLRRETAEARARYGLPSTRAGTAVDE